MTKGHNSKLKIWLKQINGMDIVVPFTWGAVVVVIVWYLDLQLSLQSVPITTNIVSSNPL
jgi:hypothetical protein